jgi:hypothetical protein
MSTDKPAISGKGARDVDFPSARREHRRSDRRNGAGLISCCIRSRSHRRKHCTGASSTSIARLPQDDGGFVFVVLRMAHLAEPLMKNGGTLFTKRQPDGGQKPQRHGGCEGGAGSCRALYRGRTRSQRHQGTCDFAGSAGDARGFGYSRIRRGDGQSPGHGAHAEPRKHRRCRCGDGVPGARSTARSSSRATSCISTAGITSSIEA